MRVLFLVNPNAGGTGSRRKVDIALGHFKNAGWSVDLVRTENPEHSGELINSAGENGYELLVLAGGDGTLHSTVKYLDLENEGGQPIPFGIIPLGSGNDFFRGMGAPGDPDGAAMNIVEGSAHAIDIGVVEPVDENGHPREGNAVRFINTAGVGMDSQTLATREKAPGFMSARYELLFLMTLAKLYPLEVKIKADGWEIDMDAYWILCCNNGYIGSGMRVAPEAKVNDGLMDVLIIPRMSKLRFVGQLGRIFRGTHTDIPGIEIRRASELVLRCEPQQRVATDGDRAGLAPSRIRMLPGAVRLRTRWLGGVKVQAWI